MYDVNMDEMKTYIVNKFKAEGDFDFMGDDGINEAVLALIELDSEYMKVSGADDGEVYDDDEAYEHIFEGMKSRFPERKMYCMRLAEDYLDFAEEYLGSVGAIDWE